MEVLNAVGGSLEVATVATEGCAASIWDPTPSH